MGKDTVRATKVAEPPAARGLALPAGDASDPPDPESVRAVRVTTTDEAVTVLVDRHREFLAFLERRVGDRDAAEDLLQAALVRAIEKINSLRDDQRVVPWFYRMLRNDLTDHYRRDSAERRALERQVRSEPLAADSDTEPLHGVTCRCVAAVLPTLPSQYAAILKRVELDGASVNEVADEQGISANNVRVRLHRARRALRKQVKRHCRSCADEGCLDCTCARRRRTGCDSTHPPNTGVHAH